MRSFIITLIFITALCACKTPKLAERIPGRWHIEHYEEYNAATGQSSGHSLDGCGYLQFHKGRFTRGIRPGRPAGTLTSLQDARYAMEDSLFVIRDATGATLERWLLTKDLIDYMEWVRVSDDRDSVFTMYLGK